MNLAQMQGIQPEVTALNAKYKGLKMNDPKKAEQKPGIDGPVQEARHQPVGGCLADAAAAAFRLCLL